jgi:hypothetical protein
MMTSTSRHPRDAARRRPEAEEELAWLLAATAVDPTPIEPRGYAVQQVWSALDPKVSESAKTV